MMNSTHAALCIILILFPSVTGTVFSFENPDSRSGTPKCSVFTDKFGYVHGKSLTYDYNIQTITKVNGFSKDDARIYFRSKVTITALSECEFVMSMSEVTLNNVENPLEEGSPKEALFQQAVYFSFHNGEIKTIWEPDPDPKSYHNPSDVEWTMNIKRGVLSLFQSSLDSFYRPKSLIETDVLGKCHTHYKVDTYSYSLSFFVTKSKDLDSCEGRQQYTNTVHSVNYGDDTVDTQPPLMKSSYVCHQSFSKKTYTLISAYCEEKYVFRPSSHGMTGTYSAHIQTLHYISTHNSDKAGFPDKGSRVTSLLFQYHFGHHPNTGKEGLSKILDILQELCLKYGDDVRPSVPELLEVLVSAMRRVDVSGLLKIHERVSSQNFCPDKTNHIRQYFLDAVPMVQSLESVNMIVETISNRRIGATDAVLWLTSISLISQPSREMIAACIPLLRMKDRPENTALALSSLIRNYCHTIGDTCQQDTAVDMFLWQQEAAIVGNGGDDNTNGGCTHQSGETTTDVVMALRAIGNLGYFQKILRRVAGCFTRRGNPSEVRVAALEAMRRTHCGTTIPGLNELFFDDTEDSEIRIRAYIILMRCPSHEFLVAVHETLLKEKTNQVGSYIWSHLSNLVETADPHLQAIRTILEDVVLKKKVFDLDGRKFSRYYEKSLYSATLDVGAKLDSNVIFSAKSFIPRSANLNFTMHLFGRAVNFLEVGGRAQAVDQILENFFGPTGFFSDPLTPNAETTNFSQGKKYLSSKPIDREKFLVSFYIRVFGNEIYYSNDISLDRASKILENFLTLEKFKFTRSLSLLDTETVLPTCSGLPLHLKVRSTGSFVLDGAKLLQLPSFLADIKPSASIRVTGQMYVEAFNSRAGVQILGTVHSSAGFSVEMNNGDLTFDLSKKKVEIFNFRSDMYLIHGASTKLLTVDMEVDDNNINNNKKKVCSSEQALAITGLRLCQEINIPNVFLSRRGPFIPLTGSMVYDLHLIKEDMPEGVLVTIIPFEDKSMLTVDTPESKQQRAVYIVASTKEEYLTVEVVSRWRSVNLTVVPIKNQNSQTNGARIILKDGDKLYTASVWTKSQQWVNGTLWMSQLDVTRPDHEWTVKSIITQVPGKNIQIIASSEGFETRNMILSLTKINIVDATSVTGTLKFGPDEYTLKGGLDQPWKKAGFKYVSYLKVTVPDRTVLDFSAGISNEPNKRILIDVKLDKLYSKLVSFYGLITFNAVSKQSKNILRISMRSPLGTLRLHSDHQFKDLESRNQIIFYYNFGPKYIDRLKIVADTETMVSTNSSEYFGKIHFSSKKKPTLALNSQGQLIIHLNDGWQIGVKTHYGSPKDKYFINFQSLFYRKTTNSSSSIKYNVSLNSAGKRLEFQADTSYTSGPSNFSRKFQSSLTSTTAPGNGLKTSVSFENKETKDLRFSAVSAMFSSLNHEIFFSEELTQQKIVPMQLTNDLQVQWQKGRKLTVYTTFQNYSGIAYQMNTEISTPSGRTANFDSMLLNMKDHYKAKLQLNADSGLLSKKKIEFLFESSLRYITSPEDSFWELVVNQAQNTNQNLSIVAVISTGKQSKQSFRLISHNSNAPNNNFNVIGKHFWLKGKYHSLWSFTSSFRRMEQNLTFDPAGIELRYAANSDAVLYGNDVSGFILHFVSPPRTQNNAISKLTASLHGVHTANISVQFSKTDKGYDSKGSLDLNVLGSNGHVNVDLSYDDFNQFISSGMFHWHPSIHNTNLMDRAPLSTPIRNGSFQIVYNKEGMIHTGSSYMEISALKPIIVKASLQLTDSKDFINISIKAENGNNPYLREVGLNFYYQINDKALTTIGSMKILPYFDTSSLEISLVKGHVSKAVIKLKTPYESLRSLELIASFESDFRDSKVIKVSLKHNDNELIGLNLQQYFPNYNDFDFTLFAEAYNGIHEPISLNFNYKLKFEYLLVGVTFKMAPRIAFNSILKKWGTKQFQTFLKVTLDNELYKASFSDKNNFETVDISLSTPNIKVVIFWNINNDNKEVSRITFQIASDGTVFVLSGLYQNLLHEKRINIHMKIRHLIYKLLVINSRESGKSMNFDFEIQNRTPMNSEIGICNFREWFNIHVVFILETDLKDRQNISARFDVNSTCTQHFIVFYKFSRLNEYGNRESIRVTSPDHGLSGLVAIDTLFIPVLKYDIHLSLDELEQDNDSTAAHPRKEEVKPPEQYHNRRGNTVDIMEELPSETSILFVSAEWISNEKKIRVKADLTKHKHSVYFHQNSTATTLFLYRDNNTNTNAANNKAKKTILTSGRKSSDRFAVSIKDIYLKLIRIHLPYKPSLVVWIKMPRGVTTLLRDDSGHDVSKFNETVIGEMRLDFGAVSKAVLRVTTPNRTIEVSGTFDNQQRDLQAFIATFMYDAGANNNGNKFLLKMNGENGYKTKRLGIAVLLPHSKNEVKLKVKLSGREHNSLMNCKAVFTISKEGESQMSLVFHAKLLEDDGKYQLNMLTENLYTDTFFKLESYIILTPDLYDLELYSYYINSRKELTRWKNLEMHWSGQKLQFQVFTPKKEIGFIASVDTHGTYRLLVRRLKSEHLAEDFLMEVTFDTAANSFSMKLMYDPDSVTNIYKMMVKLTKSGILFMDNIDTGLFNSTSYGKTLLELRPGYVLYGELVWKPNYSRDLSKYFTQALKSCLKEFRSTGLQGIEDIGMSFWAIVKPINHAVLTEVKPLLTYIKTEFENTHREYSIYYKILINLYGNNYLYVKSIHETVQKICDYLKSGLYNQFNQYRTRLWPEMVKIWEVCQQICQYLYDQFKMASIYMRETLLLNLHRTPAEYIDLVTRGVNYLKKNSFIYEITNYIKYEFGPKLTNFLMHAFKVFFENGIQIIQNVIDRLVSILAQVRGWVQSYVELPIINALLDVIKEIYYEMISAYRDMNLKESIYKSVSEKLRSMRVSLTDFGVTPHIMAQQWGQVVFEFNYRALIIPNNIVHLGRDIGSQIVRRGTSIYKGAQNLLGYELIFWDLYYEMKPSTDVPNWLPPFKAHAILFGGKHVMTFDRLPYDIKAGCSVVLSRDVLNGTFTVIANYQLNTLDHRPVSVTVITEYDEHVEILQNQKVKVGEFDVNLPLALTNGILFRTQEAVTLESSRGYRVTYNFEADLITVEISGWYFNKVAGLFGTYNNEPHDDLNLMTRVGRVLEPEADMDLDLDLDTSNSDLSVEIFGNLEKFAKTWTVSENCRSSVPLQIDRKVAIPPNSKYDIDNNDDDGVGGDDDYVDDDDDDDRNNGKCASLFLQNSSQFRNCFKQVRPNYFYTMCTSVGASAALKTPTAPAAAMPSKRKLCAVSSLYVRECQRQGVPLDMPTECLTCLAINRTVLQQGDIMALSPVPTPLSADVIVVLQETKCNSQTGLKIPQIIGNLNFLLSLINFRDTRFGLVGFGGNYTNPVYLRTFHGQIMSDSYTVGDVIYDMKFEDDRQSVDIMQALTSALQYPFRPGAMKAIILVTCSSCQDNNVAAWELEEALQGHDVILHVLAEQNFKSVGNISFETAHVYGANQLDIYPAVSNTFQNISGHQIVPDDSCAQEAIRSKGSYFNTKKLNKMTTSRSFMQTFSACIAFSLKQNPCQNCQCVPRQEGHKGHFVCHRCTQTASNIMDGVNKLSN